MRGGICPLFQPHPAPCPCSLGVQSLKPFQFLEFSTIPPAQATSSIPLPAIFLLISLLGDSLTEQHFLVYLLYMLSENCSRAPWCLFQEALSHLCDYFIDSLQAYRAVNSISAFAHYVSNVPTTLLPWWVHSYYLQNE